MSFHDAVVYQIYPKSFRDSDGDGVGDLRGIIDKVPYIASLGVDYVWFNPFYPSPGHDNGYDISDYCAVDPAMGTMEDFEELVEALGAHGIGVMLDMVLNHTSTEHEWFRKALAGDERRGLVEAEAAAGVSRTRLFVVQAGAAVIEAAILLLVSGGVLAAATAGQTTEDHAVARALVYTVSQLPGALAAIGLALALVGLAPRRWPLVWAVVAWSAFARFLGGLVELPDWARDTSVIGHYLDVTGPVDWKPLAVQGAVGLAGAVVGLLAYRRRDLGA